MLKRVFWGIAISYILNSLSVFNQLGIVCITGIQLGFETEFFNPELKDDAIFVLIGKRILLAIINLPNAHSTIIILLKYRKLYFCYQCLRRQIL